MRRLDRMIIGEVLGPWLFGTAMFTVLIVAGTYLFRITDYVVQGVGLGTITELTLLLLPAVMVKTFAMAVLLSTLLAFGRLSGDSEIVALRASGVSIVRIMGPVALFSLVVAGLAFGINETLVPGASSRLAALQNELASKIKLGGFRPLAQTILEKGRAQAYIGAQNFSQSTGTLRGATITALDEEGHPTFVLYASELQFDSSKNWRIRGGAKVQAVDGTWSMTLHDEAWPPQIPQLNLTPQDLIAGQMKDLDQLSMRQMKAQIERAKQNPNVDPAQVANLEYGYWNKIALPLAALVYGLLGAPLGIRNHRTGTATGFALSIAIIFVYLLIGNFMNVWAMGGRIPAYVASFTPVAIGLAAAGVILWRRNG